MTLPLPFVTAVSGVSFHPEAVARVRPGMTATIEREPGNPFDANACQVVVDGEPVGHIPAALAARLVRRAESAWQGEIVEKIGAAELTGLRVRVLGPVPSPRTPSGEESTTVDTTPDPTLDTTVAGRDAVVIDSIDPVLPVENTLAAQVATTLVRTRSRRVVGTLVRIDGGAVIVLTRDGTEVRYPSELVIVDA